METGAQTLNAIAALQSAKPREKAGPHTTNRYGFQVNASIVKLLDLHEAGQDYRAAFDHFDDLMIFDKSENPDRIGFYQIKSKADGVVTMKEVARARGTGPKPRSYLGKMNDHMRKFAHVVGCLGFISNLSFQFKLTDGTNSKPDHHVIKAADLHTDEVDLIKKTIRDDCESAVADGSEFLVFERTFVPLEKQETHVRGRLVEHFHEHAAGADHVPIMSLYNLLFGQIFAKTGVTQEFTTLAELYDRKTLCRCDIAAIFTKAASGRRFLDYWSAIQHELTNRRVPLREIIATETDCIRYTRARAGGEPGALAFKAAAKRAILENKAAVDACAHVSDLAALLDQWVKDPYDNRRGGSFVEAFEA
jgi:hypothetical protein